MDRGSLTQRLLVLSNHRFGVRILCQGVAVPRESERRVLALAPRRLALIREVVLSGVDEPWVYARSVLPLSSLSGELRHWRKLDARPLGARLFDRPDLGRGALEIGCVAVNSALAGRLGFGPENLLWGRRSVFTVGGKPLLVSEVFLPAFPAVRAPAED
jgi:chorismate--pyruvate lyase